MPTVVAQGVVIIYALLTVVGGVIGYRAAGSKASLIASLASGVILLGGCALSRRSPAVGFGIAAVVALALVIFFSVRWLQHGPKMPAVVMLPLSVVALLVFLWAMFAGGQSPSQS